MTDRAIRAAANGFRFALRPMIAADRALIVKSFRQSYGHDSDFADYVSDDVYKPFMSAMIERLIDSACVTVVTPPEEDDASNNTVLAFMVHEANAPVVHYLYVCAPNRRWGIAKMLLSAFGARFTFTHLTRLAAIILAQHHASWEPSRGNRESKRRGHDGPVYNPFLIPALTGASDWRPR